MLKRSLYFVLFCLSSTIFSQEWQQNSSQALFSVKKLGINVVGNFNDAKVYTNFNSNDLENSYINLKIRVKSISMGKKSRDKMILNRKYFFEKNYKFIHFKSSRIVKRKNGDLYLIGILKIKGIAKKVQIPFEVSEDDQKIIIKSNFKIKRKDFNLGENDVSLSKSAKIAVEFTGTT
ncbi:YceI family protein [Polaribacter sp. M15]